jgi:phosphate transport system substrate-binding protein
MKRLTIAVAAVLATGAMAFAGGNPEAKPAASAGVKGDYKFGGSTTIETVVRTAIEAFARKQPNAKISYEANGSATGITGVIDGVYVLGGSSRDLSAEEKTKGAVENPILLDALSIIVNGSVPVADLTRRQLADILNGTIRNWKDVGGPDKAIVLINRDEASGTRTAVSDLVLLKEYKKGEAGASFLKDAVTVTSNGDMVTKVSTTPDSIGYCGMGYVDQAKGAGAKEITVGKVAATTANVLNKTYALSRSCFLISKGAIKDGTLERAFLDFVLSAEGQAIVKQEGFVALPK